MHIITADWYWYSASELVDMFIETGFSGESKHYSEITIDELNVFPVGKPRKPFNAFFQTHHLSK